MTKFFVKKPFYILVIVVIVLTIGGVSLSKMQTDLLPEMNLPYMLVITTEPGASPQKVENDISKPMESALGVISGVKNVTSTSSDNYSMVMLEFNDDTNMDSALVRVTQAISALTLPDECGTPNTMEISMDMMATMYAAVDYEGKDIKELTTFVKENVVPYLERQDGVASISESGMVEDTIEVRLNQDKIDEINDEILGHTNKKLKEAQDKIEDAQKKLSDGKDALENQEDKLADTQTETNEKLADATVKLNQALATKAAYESQLNSLKASKAALEAEKKAYTDAKLQENYKNANDMFAELSESMGAMAKLSGVRIPESVKDAIDHPDDFEAFLKWLKKLGYGDQLEGVTIDALEQMYHIVEVRIPQIDTELANLEIEIATAQAVLDQINKQMDGMEDANTQAIAGGYSAAAGFGSASAQIAAGKTQMESAEEELKNALKTLKDSKKAARENANVDALLSLETLSSLIYAQNFSMPAGYVDDEKDNQWLVAIGEEYTSETDLEKMVLTKVPGAGKIKLSDVADITVIDNADEQYTKMNGNDAILLSVFKASTANTSSVSKGVTKAFGELEEKYEGLSLTPMMDQGDYIEDIINSVLSSILLGAVLAIIVLALFLKDVRPTIVVAFSIPFSVLFAIIVMYFTDIDINVMSLAGLCIGIGMLVDNSIVVMENVYRLRNHGMSAPRAAVQGAKQVAAPIVASTATTICVFLPMVYTSGTISDLLMPFVFTISYALIASLLVALTVVPTMGSVLLKNTKEKKHRIFDGIQNVYGRILAFCLKYKVVPLVIAIGLLVFCIYQSTQTGMTMIDDMESDQISVELTLKDDIDRESAYKIADKAMDAIIKVEGVDKVGVIAGGASTIVSGTVGAGETSFHSYSYTVLAAEDIKTTQEFKRICKNIEKSLEGLDCEECNVSSSALGSTSSMMGEGVGVNIYGDDQDKIIEISEDLVKMINSVKGCTNATNGIEEDSKQIHLKIDKNKVATKGLTVAQIFASIAGRITTDKKAITISRDGRDVDVQLVDETDVLTYENLMDLELEATTMNDKGEQVTKKYTLDEFAEMEIKDSVDSITRKNQSRYLSVTAEVEDGYNATLLSRDLQERIDSYEVPDGYMIEMAGETSQVNDMLEQMLLAIVLGFLLIYLVMVAQFQSLLSPFIIIFTVPLAFTGGMLGLMLFGQSISAMSLMGFMILMGTVVNNGIVFVDYANQLRIQGVERHTALIATGKTRMRPILMTAMTTILSMSVMVFSNDAGNAMQKGMAIVVAVGLVYATFMTLFIVPVLYDIMYRRPPRVIDVGSDNLDDVPDEASELIAQFEAEKKLAEAKSQDVEAIVEDEPEK